MDSKYILSGSEDMNIRIWKSQASAPIGTVHLLEKIIIEIANGKTQEKIRI